MTPEQQERLREIEHNYWLAGHESTGGLRQEWYGGKGRGQVGFLLNLVEASRPRNRHERRKRKKGAA